MTGTNSQPPMAWRYCGNQIKRWRTRAGVTREDLGKEAGYEYETISSMEQGRRKPSVHLLEIADQMCDAHGLLLAGQDYLKPERFLSYSTDFIHFETEAIVVTVFEPMLIPGLLQTEATVRTLLRAHWPPLDDETFEERVAARLGRQSILDDRQRDFSFIIGEAAVRYPLADPADHRVQLQHLLEIGSRRHVNIQVLPLGGVHPGLNGPFVLLETSEHDHIAYEEGQISGVLHGTAESISTITQRHAMILREALSPRESARYISELMEDA